jgi:hypothetical protein
MVAGAASLSPKIETRFGFDPLQDVDTDVVAKYKEGDT